MIDDFSGQARGALARDFDICIVGAGPAGITLARALAARGAAVALMEAGGREFSPESQDVYEGDIVGLDYYSLDTARLRFLGGSSNHWEGRCREFDAHDFHALPYHSLSGWPIAKADLDPYAAEADAILDLPPTSSLPDIPVAGAEDRFVEIRFRWSAPTRFWEKYGNELAASERIHAFTNANLVDLRLDDGLRAVTAAVFKSYAPGDPGVAVRARQYCLCMGGLENPRFLLNARSQMPAGIGNWNDLVGRYFSEHPTTEVGEILFEGTVPPRASLAPTPEMMRKNEILNFNLLTVTQGMEFGRELARSAACVNDFTERLSARVLGRPFDCGAGGIGQYFAKRWRDDYRTGRINVILEQSLNPDSRVRLGEARDAFGLRRIALDWQISELDRRTMRRAAIAFGEYLAEGGIGRVKVADWLMEEGGMPEPGRIKGLHHHMGTTRMSDDPLTGVVDRNCRVHGLANLSIGGSSVFATAGHANPTYTIVQLALRQADHLAEVLTI